MVNKITDAITPLEEIDKINEVIDEVDKKLENTATGTNALTIDGTASSSTSAVNIGKTSTAGGGYSTALGYYAAANGARTTSIGYGARIGSSTPDAIQIGNGTNSTTKSLSVGFYNTGNYQLLDGATGKIPNARLDMDTTVTSASTKPITSGAVYDAIQASGNIASRNIGEIVASTIPLTDAGLHLLDGALLQYGSYQAFIDYIASIYDASASYFCTEQEWQTAVSTYGVCGKFVYDSVNNTVRLPKYNNKIYTGGGTAPVKGNGMALGLTDGTTNYGLQGGNSVNFYELCLQTANYGANVGPNSLSTRQDIHYNAFGVTTDGSKSGIITDLSNITTSLDGYWYIVVATSTKTDIQVDIDEIATDLNGKADVDLSNVSNTSGFRKLVEVYNNGTDWYKVYSEYNPSTGVYIGQWCEQGGFYTGSGSGDTQISLLKSYKDTSYKIAFGQAMPAGTTTANAVYVRTTTITNASFSVYKPGGTYGWYWETKGYIS